MRYRVERQTFSDDTDWWMLMREFEDLDEAMDYCRALDVMDNNRRYRVFNSEVLEGKKGKIMWSSETLKGWGLYE